MATLTHHKKSVRALAQHPTEDSFASASADNTKKFSLPRGEFLHNMLLWSTCLILSFIACAIAATETPSHILKYPPLMFSRFSFQRGITNKTDAVQRPSVGAYSNGPTAVNAASFRRHPQVPAADKLHQTKPFSLILPKHADSVRERPVDKKIEMKNNIERSYEILASGMVLLKNYLNISDQVEIVNICQELGVGPGGFYQHGFSSGSKMNLHRMFFGLNWDPQTHSWKRYRSDGFEAPPLPGRFISLVETTLEEARELSKSENEVPFMSPDICIVNFYTTTDRLNLHQAQKLICLCGWEPRWLPNVQDFEDHSA